MKWYYKIYLDMRTYFYVYFFDFIVTKIQIKISITFQID